MNISFLKNEPLNSVIVDSANRRPLYDVVTPWKLSGKTTTIRRTTSSGQEQVIAQIHWHHFGSNKITYMGTEMPMDDFLRRSHSVVSHTKQLTGVDGKQYEWQRSTSKFSLVDCQTNATVAQSHRKKTGLFSKARKMNIDINLEGMQNIDIIIVSFIVMQEKYRQESDWIAVWFWHFWCWRL